MGDCSERKLHCRVAVAAAAIAVHSIDSVRVLAVGSCLFNQQEKKKTHTEYTFFVCRIEKYRSMKCFRGRWTLNRYIWQNERNDFTTAFISRIPANSWWIYVVGRRCRRCRLHTPTHQRQCPIATSFPFFLGVFFLSLNSLPSYSLQLWPAHIRIHSMVHSWHTQTHPSNRTNHCRFIEVYGIYISKLKPFRNLHYWRWFEFWCEQQFARKSYRNIPKRIGGLRAASPVVSFYFFLPPVHSTWVGVGSWQQANCLSHTANNSVFVNEDMTHIAHVATSTDIFECWMFVPFSFFFLGFDEQNGWNGTTHSSSTNRLE